ncbi:MAG: DUF2442 domain-containing protein [Planctomycetota bacterium]
MNDLRIQSVSFASESMTVEFSDGCAIFVPLCYFRRLQEASPSQRDQWQLIGRGLGVHWESVDEDLSVENVLLAYSRSKKEEYAKAAQT